MPDCLFCGIRDRRIPATLVHEDESVIAFEDINPQAPTHILIIPRKHIATLNDLAAEDAEIIGHMTLVAAKVAADRGHSAKGWRAVMNCNRDAGQTVFHVHMHVLGGRPLEWPPG